MIAQFTAAYEKRGRWYIGHVEEIPGVNTQGKTLTEAKRNLKEALVLVLEANRAIAIRDKDRHAIEDPISVLLE